MDIRRYFGGSMKAGTLSKKGQNVPRGRSDVKRKSDVEKDVNGSNAPRKRAKKVAVLSDTDSDGDVEIVTTKKKPVKPMKRPTRALSDSDNTSEKKPVSTHRKTPTPKPSIPVKSPSPKKTPVSVTDFFGGGSISQSSKRITADRKSKLEERSNESSQSAQEDLAKKEKAMKSPTKKLHREEAITPARRVSPRRKASAESTNQTPTKSDNSTISRKLADRAKAAKSLDLAVKTKKSRIEPEDDSDAVIVADTPPQPKAVSHEASIISKKEKTSPPAGITPKTPTSTQTPKNTSPEEGTPKSGPKQDEETPTSARGGGSAYRGYLNRAGPQALGSKDIPEGAPNCLEGLTFVITGVLESIDRDDCKVLIEKHGGKVTTNVSKNTKFVVLGRDAGTKKTRAHREIQNKNFR